MVFETDNLFDFGRPTSPVLINFIARSLEWTCYICHDNNVPLLDVLLIDNDNNARQ